MHSPLPAARQLVPALCALVLLAGCGNAPRSARVPLPVPAPASEPTPEEPVLADGAVVTIAELLRLARRQAPTAEAVAALRAAALAAVRQAGSWSNPELELRTGVSRPRAGEEPDRRTWGADLRQRLELPAKRSARIAAAHAGGAVAGHEADQAWLDLEAEVRAAAVALAAAQAAAEQADSAAALAAELRRTVESRALAGDLARADLARARLEEATAGIALAARRREAAAALAVLRSWCGTGLPERIAIADALPGQPPPVGLDALLRQAREGHPRLRQLAASVAMREAEMEREDRAWLPDLTLGLSADRSADADEVGVALGIDLPLWNRGDGAWAAAAAERSRAAAGLRAERLAAERAVAAAWHAYESARGELADLAAQAQPAAEEAVRLRRAAWAAGEDSLADVLEARRAAQAVAEAELAARRAAAESAIALGRAVGSFAVPTETTRVQP